MFHTAYARSPCGQYAAAGQGEQVLVWDTVHEHPILVFENAYKSSITVVNWSSDGCVLLAGSGDGAILAWSIASRSLLLTGRIPYVFGAVIEVVCSSRSIAGLHLDGQIQVWDLRIRKLITCCASSPGATDLNWSADGQVLSTNAGDRWHIALLEARCKPWRKKTT